MVTDYFDVKLETKDLILKKAEFEDWKTIYYNLWRHKESAKYMLWQPTETDEDAKDRMKRTIAFEEKPENKYALFVYLKKTGEAIGFAGMRELERGIYEETGIALGPEFVRKGYGRQILTALLEEAGKLGAKEFHACNRTAMLRPECYSCHVDLYSIHCQKKRQIQEQVKRMFWRTIFTGIRK